MNLAKDLFSGPLFFIFSTFAVILVFVIRTFENGFSDFNFDVIVSLDCTWTQMIGCFLMCYFGANLTAKLEKIANIMYNTSWYTFSVKQRKLVVAIMRQAQEPIMLNGFSVFSCSLEMFATVSGCLCF